uniref:Uncharacterized protein n=1 Tax=Tetraselmis sp. GSL018 TaxID=582737 RepID=A0A061SHV4_9CHLO
MWDAIPPQVALSHHHESDFGGRDAAVLALRVMGLWHREATALQLRSLAPAKPKTVVLSPDVVRAMSVDFEGYCSAVQVPSVPPAASPLKPPKPPLWSPILLRPTRTHAPASPPWGRRWEGGLTDEQG